MSYLFTPQVSRELGSCLLLLAPVKPRVSVSDSSGHVQRARSRNVLRKGSANSRPLSSSYVQESAESLSGSNDSAYQYQQYGQVYSDDSSHTSAESDGEADTSDSSSSSRSSDEQLAAAEEHHKEVVDTTKLYWNDQFQELMSNLEDSKTWSKLSTLGRDFISVAEMYGRYVESGLFLAYHLVLISYFRVIISELYVDNKTIPPINVGGIAGGSKYIVQGILFKFTLDTCLKNSIWLYGKNKRNDEKGMMSIGFRFLSFFFFFWRSDDKRTDI